MIAEHRWTTLSRHRTSEGTVLYESCHCGLLRIRQSDPDIRSVTFSRPQARSVTERCGR